jgi:hypothetical protein
VKRDRLLKGVIISIILLLIFILGLSYIVLRMDEDSWIKDSKGVWVKHGNPSKTPNEIKEQSYVIQLYQEEKYC